MSGSDARAKRDAGANLVQLYTGLIYRGPDLVPECVNALRP
jgi:dihydroorotate dehydrogenase